MNDEPLIGSCPKRGLTPASGQRPRPRGVAVGSSGDMTEDDGWTIVDVLKIRLSCTEYTPYPARSAIGCGMCDVRMCVTLCEYNLRCTCIVCVPLSVNSDSHCKL